MAESELEVGLFQFTPDGVALIGRSRNPDLVGVVREQLAAEHRRGLARIEGRPLRLVAPRRDQDPSPEGAGE